LRHRAQGTHPNSIGTASTSFSNLENESAGCVVMAVHPAGPFVLAPFSKLENEVDAVPIEFG
ncbi:hypothetical protein, partial [Mycolicibacterium fortuitum]|uniref:hypothetical protein n=1 Tax=Mycolicibacterium fortuitum TaxID=1766 RepID=UPI001C257904